MSKCRKNKRNYLCVQYIYFLFTFFLTTDDNFKLSFFCMRALRAYPETIQYTYLDLSALDNCGHCYSFFPFHYCNVSQSTETF